MNNGEQTKARALGLNHVVLEVDDLDQALEFYGSLFDFTLRGRSDHNAFIDLGEAYLALGRPRDAIQVGNVGLEAAPDNLEGRVMLARAFAALHQW